MEDLLGQVESVLLDFRISIPCALFLATGRGDHPWFTSNRETATNTGSVSRVAHMHIPVLAYLLTFHHPQPGSMLPAFQGKGLSEVRRRAPNQERHLIFKWLSSQFRRCQVGTKPGRAHV